MGHGQLKHKLWYNGIIELVTSYSVDKISPGFRQADGRTDEWMTCALT